MTTFDPSEYARKRARQNVASVNKTKSRSPHGAGYVRDTNRQCPKHHVDYVLRPSTRKAPVLLIYDCPELGCFNTLQVPSKR
jgi:hypothetical protein